jgi:C4-dicarboxylate-specific signal transduction histidine kinase
VKRYGAWNVDEADPVRIEISEPADDDQAVLITVTDRGLGVPEEHFTHMFDWFWSSNKPPLQLL